MTRLNLSELVKERLEKSYLRYEYEDNTGTGKLVSTCPKCSVVHDRDKNASINLEQCQNYTVLTTV